MQLVNSICVKCGERISCVLDAHVCPQCMFPVHNLCVNQMIASNHLSEDHCPKCGAQTSSSNAPVAKTPARNRLFSLRKVPIWLLGLTAILWVMVVFDVSKLLRLKSREQASSSKTPLASNLSSRPETIVRPAPAFTLDDIKKVLGKPDEEKLNSIFYRERLKATKTDQGIHIAFDSNDFDGRADAVMVIRSGPFTSDEADQIMDFQKSSELPNSKVIGRFQVDQSQATNPRGWFQWTFSAAPANTADQKVQNDLPPSEQTIEHVRRIVANHTGIPIVDVTVNTTMAQLHLDALDFVELVLALDEEFKIALSDDEKFKTLKNPSEAPPSITVGELASMVESRASDSHK